MTSNAPVSTNNNRETAVVNNPSKDPTTPNINSIAKTIAIPDEIA
jgi:hypothetical protein